MAFACRQGPLEDSETPGQPYHIIPYYFKLFYTKQRPPNGINPTEFLHGRDPDEPSRCARAPPALVRAAGSVDRRPVGGPNERLILTSLHGIWDIFTGWRFKEYIGLHVVTYITWTYTSGI